GLAEERVHAHLGNPLRSAGVGVAAHHDHWQSKQTVIGPHSPDQFETIHPGHVEIGHQRRDRPIVQDVESLAGGRNSDDSQIRYREKRDLQGSGTGIRVLYNHHFSMFRAITHFRTPVKTLIPSVPQTLLLTMCKLGQKTISDSVDGEEM